MQKMIRSPATPGLIGPLWCLHLVAAIYARPRNKATTAAAVARAGQKMSMKFNIKYTKFFQETGNRKEDHKLRVQASGVQSLQARGPGTQSTSVQAGPGHKLPGQMYVFDA